MEALFSAYHRLAAVSYTHLDASLLEAAKVDGSNRWKDFWFIILPLIKPQLKIMIILTFIGCIQDYGGIFLPVSYTHLDVYKRQV